MRLRICRRPTLPIDDVRREFRLGGIYEVGPQIGSVLLAEGWAEPADLPDAGAADERHQPRVLVVDDDADTRRLAAGLLAGDGYDVDEACHGHDALSRLQQRTPDLVLLDLDMPVMDGWQFRAEQQRLADARLAAIPVIVVSAADDAVAQARALNATAVVTKPFEPDRLLDAIRVVLRR